MGGVYVKKVKKKLDFSPFLCYVIGMKMIKKLEKLQNDLAWWQDQLNRSRKESTRSISMISL